MPELAMLKQIVEMRSLGLRDHEQRLGRYAAELCGALDLDPGFTAAMSQACSFHDLGKIVLPDSILLKPTALTPNEWDVMRSHSQLGHDILKHGVGAVTELAASVALTHHESFDGSGYPRGLRGNEIPLEGRIAHICDVYDALREHRVYRRGLTHERTMDIILKGDDQTSVMQFDPQVLQAFAAHAGRYATLFEEYEKETHRLPKI